MDLNQHLMPWTGAVYRHIPTPSSFGLTDFRFCGMTEDGRWSYGGQPTLYLAGTQAIAIQEYGRHHTEKLPGIEPVSRTLYRLNVTLAEVVDLRQMELRRNFELEQAESFFDLDKTRAVANLIRRTSRAQGMMVPPLGCLDRPDALNLVVFLERFSSATSFVTSTRKAGTFAFIPSVAEKAEGTGSVG